MNRITLYLPLLLWLSLSHAAAGSGPVPVTATPLAKQLIFPDYTAPATTISLNDSSIGFETSGRMLRLPVRVGEQVSQGQLLAELDCRDNRSSLRQTQAGLDAAGARVHLAKRQIERTRSLVGGKNVSQELHNQREAELRTANADYASARATLEISRLNVDRCKLSAPFAGIVMERLASEGEWLTPGKPVLRLLDSERLEVSAQVPVHLVGTLAGAESLELESNQGRFPLKLARVAPVVETLGRYREARLEFSDRRTLPGSSGRLVWRTSNGHLPADLPVRRDGRLGIFLIEQGRARFHPLPGALEGHPTAVDLPTDSRIIIEGRHALNDGDPIETRP
jgi:RND family efflux transporter MFP subunit